MEASLKRITDKIPTIFETMDYGENFEKMQEATDWLKCRDNVFFAYVDKSSEAPNGMPFKLQNTINNELLCTVYVPEIDTIKKILSKKEDHKWKDLDPIEKSKIIFKIGTEIEKKDDLFAQLEILTRGILTKDTKTNALPLLAQYFTYYSAFAFVPNDETSKPKPLGTAVCVISNENYLAHLGLFLAPALAAGCNVILQIGTHLAPIAFLLQDIASSSGLPDGTFKIIPSDDGELLPYLSSEQVDVVTLFVDLNHEKYRGINTLNKKVLVLSSYKSPIIVFDSADLDASSESVIETSWGYQSLLPWSADTILVQENVLETFYNKLKSKLQTLKVAPANDLSANISSSLNKSSLDCLNKLINEAKLQGIEVFQAENNCSKWSPTILKGGKVNTNNALRSSENEAKAVTILAFRSIDEAVNLANNTKQGLWASVWSDNVGLVNEVTSKLKVSNIWVNGNTGVISPDVIISPIKESGAGNFGGKEGFFEYLDLDKNEYSSNNSVKYVIPKSVPNIDSIINTAKKAQESWQRLSKIQKQKIFQEFAEYLPLQAKNAGCPEQTWLASALKSVYAAIRDSYKDNISSVVSGRKLFSIREPRGVLVIDATERLNAQLILSSIFEGNSVIVCTIDGEFENNFKYLSQKLPNGILTLVPYAHNVIQKLAANKQVNVYFGNGSRSILKCLPIRDSKNYANVSKLKEDLYGKINYVKNIWSDIGKSSACNFN